MNINFISIFQPFLIIPEMSLKCQKIDQNTQRKFDKKQKDEKLLTLLRI